MRNTRRWDRLAEETVGAGAVSAVNVPTGGYEQVLLLAENTSATLNATLVVRGLVPPSDVPAVVTAFDYPIVAVTVGPGQVLPIHIGDHTVQNFGPVPPVLQYSVAAAANAATRIAVYGIDSKEEG